MKLPNIKQFFLVSAIVIVERKVWRIWILISGCKGLILQSWYWFICATLCSCGIADQRNRRFIIFGRQFYTTFIWWRQQFRRWRNYWWGMKTKQLIKMLSIFFWYTVNCELISRHFLNVSSLKDHIIWDRKIWWSLQSSGASPKIDKGSLFRLLVVADTCRLSLVNRLVYFFDKHLSIN